MAIPQSVQQLVERFEMHREAYLSGTYNEAQLRREFLDPMFRALGWDVDNEKGYAEQYKDVIHEDSIKIGAMTKAPDYCFRIGGTRKFFLEAKKPSINLKDDPSPAYQLRRYAWSAKLPLSILTDFEEFIVYDTRVRPDAGDKASKARTFYIRYDEFPQRWPEIEKIFSRDSVLKGSFDKYVETAKGKRGTAEVDDAFLAEIEDWREILAKNIALRNSNLSQRELNFSVQRTIDRVIFLRICEDRGIEEYGQLQALQNGANVYDRLRELFTRADQRYNSGLFHFHTEKGRAGAPDTLTPNLAVDDKVLKSILKQLYYPASPYEFSVLSADILGQVYERFLGSVIRLTKGHRALVEQKPEVRKAGGVYYTPTYIVDYIVKQTVGELLKGAKPGPRGSAAKLRILDPACGSGSFLLGAYQYLLDWHLQQYQEDAAKWSKGKNPTLYQHRAGGWRLTTAERKRILLANIYGVDIDPQAVEVTKLSLLLKVLEEENAESLDRQLRLFHDRALPDLGDNIKCGNSLIGPDFYDNRQMELFDEEELYRINAFDWKTEFPAIFKAGGFDAVIGNPPYGALFSDNEKDYLRKYKTFVSRGESYLVFIEKAITLLLKKGVFGYIVPDTYLNLGFTQVLRDLILSKAIIKEIVLLPSTVFSSATVDTTLLFFEKAFQTENNHETNVNVITYNKKRTITKIEEPDRQFSISTKYWYDQKSFNLQCDNKEISIVKKMECSKVKIGSIAEMFSGIKAYEVGKGTPPQTTEIRKNKPFTSNIKTNEEWSPFIDGKHISRYQLLWNNNNWIKYGPWLAAPRKKEQFDGEKILIRKIIGKTLICTYIPFDSYCNTLLFILKLKSKSAYSLKTILGILNSNCISWYFRKRFQISDDDTFPQIMIRDIIEFPVPIDNKKTSQDIEKLVERMLGLNRKLPEASTEHERTLLERRIAATDAEIDRLVYRLYDLSEEEIRIVEGED